MKGLRDHNLITCNKSDKDTRKKTDRQAMDPIFIVCETIDRKALRVWETSGDDISLLTEGMTVCDNMDILREKCSW